MTRFQSLKYILHALASLFMYGVYLPQLVSARDTLTVVFGIIFAVLYTWVLVDFIYGEVKKFNKKEGNE